MTALVNETEFEFEDISSEIWREYLFADAVKVRIEAPVSLARTEDGHRIFDESGKSHYVPNKWVHLTWEAKPGKPHFVL